MRVGKIPGPLEGAGYSTIPGKQSMLENQLSFNVGWGCFGRVIFPRMASEHYRWLNDLDGVGITLPLKRRFIIQFNPDVWFKKR